VPNRNQELHRAWKEANDQVRKAEERLAAAWTAFSSAKGGPPDPALLAEVARLRRECDARLKAVLESHKRPNKPGARSRSERPSS